MTLKPELDSLDGVGESIPISDVYSKDEDSGKYRLALDPESGMVLANPGKIQATAEARKRERDEALSALKPFRELETSPEEIAELREFKSKYEGRDWTPKEEVQERMKAQVAEATAPLKDQVSKAQAELSAAREQLQKELIQNQALRLLNGGVDPKAIGNPDLLLPVIESRTRVVFGKDGKATVQPLAADRESIMHVQDKSGEMVEATFEDLILSLFKDPRYAGAWRGPDAKGAGSGSSSGGGGQKFDHIKDPAARIAAIREAQG